MTRLGLLSLQFLSFVLRACLECFEKKKIKALLCDCLIFLNVLAKEFHEYDK